MARRGYIKLHRKIRDNPIFNDPQLLRLWFICLTEAAHKEHDQIVGRQTVHLMPGEFVTGRFEIAEMYNHGLRAKEKVTGEKTVFRWLETLERGGFLTIKKTNKFSVVSIDNWGFYQGGDFEKTNKTSGKRPSNDQQNEQKNANFDRESDQQISGESPSVSRDSGNDAVCNDQQKTNKRPTNESILTTNNNVKNVNKEYIVEILDYLNEKAGTNYRASTKSTVSLINGRLGEGRTVEDFKKVIDIKVEDWLGNEKYEKYLRPNTLFTPTNFENYLNQANRKRKAGRAPQLDLFTQSEEEANFLNDIYRRRSETGGGE